MSKLKATKKTYERYAKYVDWTHLQAAALLVGLDPVEAATGRAYRLKQEVKCMKEYYAMEGLIKNNFKNRKAKDDQIRIAPKEVIEWAKNNKDHVPPTLEKLVRDAPTKNSNSENNSKHNSKKQARNLHAIIGGLLYLIDSRKVYDKKDFIEAIQNNMANQKALNQDSIISALGENTDNAQALSKRNLEKVFSEANTLYKVKEKNKS